MISKEFKESISEGLPVFAVFMCGAIAQLIMGTKSGWILKLFFWLGLYLLASLLYRKMVVK